MKHLLLAGLLLLCAACSDTQQPSAPTTMGTSLNAHAELSSGYPRMWVLGDLYTGIPQTHYFYNNGAMRVDSFVVYQWVK